MNPNAKIGVTPVKSLLSTPQPYPGVQNQRPDEAQYASQSKVVKTKQFGGGSPKKQQPMVIKQSAINGQLEEDKQSVGEKQ